MFKIVYVVTLAIQVGNDNRCTILPMIIPHISHERYKNNSVKHINMHIIYIL